MLERLAPQHWNLLRELRSAVILAMVLSRSTASDSNPARGQRTRLAATFANFGLRPFRRGVAANPIAAAERSNDQLHHAAANCAFSAFAERKHRFAQDCGIPAGFPQSSGHDSLHQFQAPCIKS
jgi:hypothetical protein